MQDKNETIDVAIMLLRCITAGVTVFVVSLPPVLLMWIGTQSPFFIRAAISGLLILVLTPFSLVRRSRAIAVLVCLGLGSFALFMLFVLLHESSSDPLSILFALSFFGTPVAVVLERRKQSKERKSGDSVSLLELSNGPPQQQ